MSSSRTWISVGLVAAAVLLAVAFLLDDSVNVWVRANRPDWYHEIARAVSLLGTAAAFLPLLAILSVRGWVLDDRRLLRLAAIGAVALVLAGIASPTMKLVFSRIRPNNPGAGTFQLFALSLADSSFPSGHTMAAFALAGVLASEVPGRARWAILGIALLVPVVRVTGGRHFLADVVAGLLLGLLLARLARSLVARWRERRAGSTTGEVATEGDGATGRDPDPPRDSR